MDNRGELLSLSLPIREWLQKNFGLHVLVVIDAAGVRLVEDTMFMHFDPLPPAED